MRTTHLYAAEHLMEKVLNGTGVAHVEGKLALFYVESAVALFSTGGVAYDCGIA